VKDRARTHDVKIDFAGLHVPDRYIFGWQMPTLWLQAVNSVFVIALAPVFALIWTALGSRHRLFFGLTYDTLGYLVPPDEWMTGRNNNYEESVSLGRAAAPTVDQAWRSLTGISK